MQKGEIGYTFKKGDSYMATKKPTKRNAQDITLINLRAIKKELAEVKKDMKKVKQEIKKKANK